MLANTSKFETDKKKILLICIQTIHSHWASISGYHQFIGHMPDDIRVSHHRVTRREVNVDELKGFENIWFRVLLRSTIGRINPWTTENDLLTECRLVREVQTGLKERGRVVVHFLDGEIGFNFFGTLRRFLGQGRNRVRLVASYHQTEEILKKVLPHRERARDLNLVLTVGTSQLPFFNFLPQNIVRFIPHGVDTRYFQPDHRVETGKKVICLTVGYWLRDFDALEKVVKAAPENIVFRIVSGKENVERFRGFPNAEVYSGIEDSELLRLYQQSDIGLMPLLDSTANNSLLEMMSCGLPIITTRVGSVKDYLPEGTGILLERNDPQEIINAICSLNTETRRTLGDAARNRALELDWAIVGLQMAEHYRKLFETS